MDINEESLDHFEEEIKIEKPPLLESRFGVVGLDTSWPENVKLFMTYPDQMSLCEGAACLATSTYLTICNLNYEVVYRENARDMSPSGHIPFLQCGTALISEADAIASFIRLKGKSSAPHTELNELADIKAYISLTERVLGNAEDYACWILDDVYNQWTKQRFANNHAWPLNKLLPWLERRSITSKLKACGLLDKTFSQVCQEVEQCCSALNERLKNREFIFPKRISEADAMVFGHLHTIATAGSNLPNVKLSDTVLRFDSLTEYCQRMHDNFLTPDVAKTKLV